MLTKEGTEDFLDFFDLVVVEEIGQGHVQYWTYLCMIGRKVNAFQHM